MCSYMFKYELLQPSFFSYFFYKRKKGKIIHNICFGTLGVAPKIKFKYTCTCINTKCQEPDTHLSSF